MQHSHVPSTTHATMKAQLPSGKGTAAAYGPKPTGSGVRVRVRLLFRVLISAKRNYRWLVKRLSSNRFVFLKIFYRALY